MKKVSETVFVCSNCGNEFNKWSGQCPGCREWNTLKEAKGLKVDGRKGVRFNQKRERTEVVNLGETKPIPVSSFEKGDGGIYISTQISEFDRVLGKGLVRGSVVLFSGEPGIGKSTLLTELIGKIGGLYVAGEESPEQIRMRVRRLKLDEKKFDILATNSTDEVVELLDRVKNVYKIAVVDSIQVMVSEGVTGTAGSVSQIKESTFRLIESAKKNGVAMFIVGHVTKEGDIAGPKLLEHMVDTVLYFEGERVSDLRILRSTKNRFGPADEVGVFKMEEGGLKEVRGKEINLAPTSSNVSAGKAVSVVMGGTRPMMVEIQSLVTESFAPMPTRVFSGIDNNRGKLLVAVAQKVFGIPLYKYDVYLSVTGGIKIEDTGVDLAVVAAMWSSYKEKPLVVNQKKDLVFIGEVSLLGEVKKVRNWDKRVKEARALDREVVEMENVGELRTLVKG